jgi:ribosomal protein L29
VNKRMKPYRDLDADGAIAKIAELKRSLYDLRVKQAAGYLEKSSKLKDVRRDIARLETLRTVQAKAGVKPTPAPKKAAAAPAAEKPAAKRTAAKKTEAAPKAAKAPAAKKTKTKSAAAAK